MAEGIKPNTF